MTPGVKKVFRTTVTMPWTTLSASSTLTLVASSNPNVPEVTSVMAVASRTPPSCAQLTLLHHALLTGTAMVRHADTGSYLST